MPRERVKFTVTCKNAGENFEPMGQHEFVAVPLTGDFVTVDRSGTGHAYRVKAVIHPLEPVGTAGD